MVESAPRRAAQRRAGARRWLALLGVAAWTLLLNTALASQLLLVQQHLGTDFLTAYWQAAKEIAGGQSPYAWLAAGQPQQGTEYVYPPLLALLLAPLTRVLDDAAALALWLLFSAACLLGGLALSWRLGGLRLHGPGAVPLLVFLPLAPTIVGGLGWGRLSPLLLLLVAAAYAALRAERATAAGALLASAAALKAFPSLLGGYLLLRRRWRAASAAVLAGLAILLLSALALGWEVHAEYLTRVLPAQHDVFGAPANESVTGFFTRLLVANRYTAPLAAAEALGQALIALSTLALLAGAAYAIWRARASARGDAAAYGLAVVTSLLVAPINAIDHLTIAALPLALAGGCAQAAWPRYRAWLVGVMALLSLPVDLYDLWPVRSAYLLAYPAATVADWPWRHGWGVLLGAGPFVGLLGLYLLLARLCLDREATEAP